MDKPKKETQVLARFFKKHSWVLTCFFAIVLIPQSLTLQSKLEGRLIITGLAIEKNSSQYQVTAQIVSPSAGLISGKDAAGIDFVSVSASTIREAITKIATNTTKSPGLGHMNFVVIGESVFNDDLTSVIDFIVRDAHTDTSVLMLVAKNATEQIKNTKNLELGSAIQLRKAFLAKQNMCNGVMTIANKFLANKFNPSASSVVSYLEIENEPEQNQQTTTSLQDGTQSTNESNQSGGEKLIKQGRIKYNLPLALFRNGKHVGNLETEDEIFGYNMLVGSSNNFIAGFSNLTQDDGSKVKITLLSKQKKSKTSVKFVNGVPEITINIKLGKNQILELISEENSLNNYKTQQNYLTKQMQYELEKQIKNKAAVALSKATELGVDILEVATQLYRKSPKQYKNYFKSHDLDDFLSSAKFKIKVDVQTESK